MCSKTPQKTILIDRKLKFQPYIVDVWSIAVFTAHFVTVRGVLAPLFQDRVLSFEDRIIYIDIPVSFDFSISE